jgi:hypothetical protein
VSWGLYTPFPGFIRIIHPVLGLYTPCPGFMYCTPCQCPPVSKSLYTPFPGFLHIILPVLGLYMYPALGLCTVHPVHPCPRVYIHNFLGLYTLYTLSWVYIHPVFPALGVIHPVYPWPEGEGENGFYSLENLSNKRR